MEQVGSLRYLADHTRPDIQFSTNRAVTDITGTFAKHALQYLTTTTQLFLQYKHDTDGIQLHGYADASWKIPPLSQSFISYVIFLNHQSGMIESVCKRLTSTNYLLSTNYFVHLSDSNINSYRCVFSRILLQSRFTVTLKAAFSIVIRINIRRLIFLN